MKLEQALKIHPELVDLDRGAVLRALEFVEACCQGRHDHFGLLDSDKEMYQAFKVLIFGKCHFPPSEKLSSEHLTDGAKVAAEFCPRSFCKNTQQPADNKGVLVAPPGRRGRKRLITPDRIIKDLAMTKGFGARKITAELERRGLQVNLRTVTRRLRAIHSQELPLFKN
jgi:hypothetical protein